jgi:hypothetical protein
MTAAFIGWALLATITIGLALYRKFVAWNHEDDMIHLSGGQNLISQQVETADKLDHVDVLGKTLTIAVTVYGVILAAIYLYGVWISSTKLEG